MLATSRSASRELSSLVNVTAIPEVDVTQPNSLANLVQALPAKPISLLVINAGVLHVDTLDTINMQHVLEQVCTLGVLGIHTSAQHTIDLKVSSQRMRPAQRRNSVALLAARG